MILDTILNANQYSAIHKGITQIIETIKPYTSENFVEGRISLCGDDLFLVFAEYDTQPVEKVLAESHRKYIDIMYVIEGYETVYVKSSDKLKNIREEYDPKIDAILADTDEDASAIFLSPGSLLILFPQDAHTPGCFANKMSHVKKIIGKILI